MANKERVAMLFTKLGIARKVDIGKEIQTSKRDKLLYLESIRGIAAVIVVFAHLLAAFYPNPVVNPGALSHGSDLMNSLFYELPFGFLVAGHFSVVVFFVLSGYVLTYRYFEAHDIKELQKQAVKRFLRLAIPVFCTVMLSYFMMSAGLMNHIKELVAITGSPEAERAFNFVPSLSQAFYDAVIGVFANKTVTYNPVLWTMSVELFGSFIVFGFAAMVGKLKYRWWLYLGAIILLSQTYYTAFILGMLLADAAHNTKLLERSRILLSKGFVALGICVVLVLASLPVLSTDLVGSLTKSFQVSGIDAVSIIRFWHFLGAFLLLWLTISVAGIQKFFSFRLFVWLGSLSFAVYLLHYLILYSLGAGIFVFAWHHAWGLHVSALVASIAVVTLTLLASLVWKKYVDDTSIGVSRVFASVMLRE